MESPFGRHMVRVVDRQDARLPPLSEIRDRVERDWRSDLALRLRDERFGELLARYTVERPDAAGVLAP